MAAASCQDEDDEEFLGLLVDAKSAHKRIVLNEKDRGLTAFEWDSVLYAYRVCHFGSR